jgi:H+/Cl- antiporter ClcA
MAQADSADARAADGGDGNPESGTGRHRRPDAGPEAQRPPVHALALLAVPAALVGIASSLVLLGVSYVAGQLQHFLWSWLPHRLHTTGSAWYWFLLVLALTGLAVGLVVRYVPGHAGPDPATQGLVGPPLPARILPGLLLTAVLGLGGGVSLGPENPVTAANVSLAGMAGRRVARRVPPPVWTALAAGGTIGALFGTPVAAALVLSEIPMGRRASALPLWDRLFGPVVAAGAGALTTVAFAQPTLALHLPGYRGLRPVDLLSGTVIAVSSVALGLLMIDVFAWSHRVFGRLGAPVVRLTVAGVVLGLLGIAGGQITLFKGLTQMTQLADTVTTYTSGGLLVVVVVKIVALIVSASAGFRGGRIFPSVFIGVALGLLAATLVPSVPATLAVASAVLGFVVAVTRSGWLSLFIGVAVANDVTLLPLLCVVMLPVWLIATGRPEMQLPESTPNQDDKNRQY